MRRLLVTGGAGFIGSAVIRKWLEAEDRQVVNVDALTYAASPEALAAVGAHSGYCFVKGDIAAPGLLLDLLERYRPQAIMHLAAESHVDRSLDDPVRFVTTNVVGSYYVLEAALRYWQGLGSDAAAAFRVVMVSTDEVFGSLQAGAPCFDETSPHQPTSPYAASKAAGDHFARAWGHSFGLPVLITHCGNNFGPWQLPEKLIPLTIMKCLQEDSIPLYGDGKQCRDWIYVDDHVGALLRILESAEPGTTWAIGAMGERANVDIVHRICDRLDAWHPRAAGSYRALITRVADRPGHDRRYAVDSGRLRQVLGWRPEVGLEDGLDRTIRWYLTNREWALASHRYDGRRLGLSRAGSLHA